MTKIKKNHQLLFRGEISDFMIFHRILSQDEIVEISQHCSEIPGVKVKPTIYDVAIADGAKISDLEKCTSDRLKDEL